MNKKEFDFINNQENSHWWFRARFNIINNVLLQYKNPNHYVLADFGCGTGEFIKRIEHNFSKVIGIEQHKYNNQYEKVVNTSIFESGLADNSVDYVTMLDVLEHIEEEDKALREVFRVLSDDGKFLITVPACKSLYSIHDEEHGHYRRYDKNDLVSVLERNGFNILKVSYFNSLLFLPLASVRLLEKKMKRKLISNDDSSGGVFNSLLFKIMNMESYLLTKTNFHFGISLIIVAEKRC